MKKRILFVQTLVLAALLAVISGCTITVIHKFEDRYYTMGGNNKPVTQSTPDTNQGATPTSNPGTTPATAPTTTPNPPDKNLLENMVEVAHLGAGYDLVFTDPENLAVNSVQNSNKVKPKVFVFTPDPNNFIDIKLLDREYRRNLPKGVSGNSLAGFRWSSDYRWTRTAKEYQNKSGFGFSAGGGVPGTASFTGSTSFKNIQDNTRNSERIYLNQDGYYEGHVLSIDLNYPHQLSTEFKSAVNNLPDHDQGAYDLFIRNWGTHFSGQATFGAKCSYRFTFTKDAYSVNSENETSFEIKAEGGAEAVKVDFGTKMDIGTKTSIQNESGSQNIEFISYGGSGQSDFGEWSRDATKNRVPIDIFFVSYLELLTPTYFPEIDPTVLSQKRMLLRAAIDKYFERHKYEGSENYAGFFVKKNIKFKGTILQMEYTAVSLTNEKDWTFVSDKNNEIYGMAGLIAFDSKSDHGLSNMVTLFDVDNAHYFKAEEGFILRFTDGQEIKWGDGKSIFFRATVTFEVSPMVLETGYLSLLVDLKEKDGTNGFASFPQKNQYSSDNRIMLKDASNEPKSLVLNTSDGDILTFQYKLERVE